MATVKTKPREKLSIELIHKTALKLIERDGIDALSMRHLATALKVDPMAVYHHIPNKAALLIGVYDAILAELFDADVPTQPWSATLRHFALRFRALVSKYPRVFPGLIASAHETQGIPKVIAIILGALVDAGFDAKTAVRAGDTFFAFVTGFALLELNAGPDMPSDNLGDDIVDPAVEQDVREALHANKFSDSFEFGLQLIVAGITDGGRRPSAVRTAYPPI